MAVVPNSTKDNTGTVEYMRLHITPLNESLLSVVVPSSVLPNARNISYHTIEAFPERQYGFIDLPTPDAEKIKKKLNGTILRGTKMRIEKAKPESIPQPTGNADAGETKREKRKSKKRKREIDNTPGIELEDRKVKRGWTTSEREMIDGKRKRSKEKKDKKEKGTKEDKDAKKKKKREVKSKYTDAPECLFKTKLPDAGAAPPKANEEATGHKKKKRKAEREVIIHEFEKTIKHPSFLKANVEKTNSKALNFEDGVGWVDENGTVVEPIVSKRPSATASKTAPTGVEDDDDTSSSGSSEDDSESDDSSEAVAQDSDSSSDEGEESDKDVETKSPPKKLKVDTQALSSPVSNMKSESARPKSSSSVTSLTIKIPPATPSSAKVHPLEALYKRTKNDATTPGGAAQEAQPFSFFEAEEDEVEEDANVEPPSQPPMTPFTKQDFEFRNLRSAAPTPDTAHPSRRTFNLWSRQDIAEEEEEEADDDDEEQGDINEDTAMADINDQATTSNEEKTGPATDFQRQFWESRGDLNRSWRKRRKAASKEKRYRENRARAERAI